MIDPRVLDALPDLWMEMGSKHYVSEYQRGRIGNPTLKLKSMVAEFFAQLLYEECDNLSRSSGRVSLVSESRASAVATFAVDNLQLTEGKWYFCVRLLEGQSAQIRWATDGFPPKPPPTLEDPPILVDPPY